MEPAKVKTGCYIGRCRNSGYSISLYGLSFPSLVFLQQQLIWVPLQWSKLGTTVYLLDEISGKPKKALNDVVKLRFKNLSSEKWGTILTGSFDMIKTALESSWLVIEVGTCEFPTLSAANFLSVFLKISRRSERYCKSLIAMQASKPL